MTSPEPDFTRFYQYMLCSAATDAARELAQCIAVRAVAGTTFRFSGQNLEAMKSVNQVLDAARQVRQRAYAPYSGFRVGAAVLDAGKRIAIGANVECSSYGLTLCAERAALAAAYAEGMDTILMVAVAADTDEPITPCGACRQWIVELAPHALVAMLTLNGRERWCTPSELLPLAFGERVFRSSPS
ncbi:MAG: cytidine deaminase [Chlorobi bacterium]|nr:cytidine deaminase [Chlorobiota bacterium]